MDGERGGPGAGAVDRKRAVDLWPKPSNETGDHHAFLKRLPNENADLPRGKATTQRYGIGFFLSLLWRGRQGDQRQEGRGFRSNGQTVNSLNGLSNATDR